MPIFSFKKLSKVFASLSAFPSFVVKETGFQWPPGGLPERSHRVPLAILLGLWLLLVLIEYQPGTWLAGWDNTMPEINFQAAVDKTVFAIWQEYRSLGFLDGMAHAANILHVAIIWLLALVMPLEFVRYIFIFGMHLLGGLGVYVLLERKLLRSFNFDTRWIAVIGALFYQFNIGTVQMFYTPLELFIVHFGLLPWLLWSLISVLENPDKRNLLLFCGLNILALPQAHVPSIFIVYMLAVGVVLGFYLFAKGKGQWRNSWRLPFKLLVLLFLINAFWGLPYVYSAYKNASLITASKINQLSNPEVILRNQAYGNFGNVARLHGFSLSYYDYVQEGKSDLMMRPWVDHLSNISVKIFEWLLFVIMLVGLYAMFRRRDKALYPVAVLCGLSFALLATDTPVIAVIPWLFRTVIPFFAEVFRFAFTKFILLFALTYSVFLSYGLSWLFMLIKERTIVRSPTFKWGIGLVGVLIFFWYSLPAWEGNFIYNPVQVKIPQAYFQLFDFFAKQDKNTRIALLPSTSFWGWTTNTWGYRGSGFTWYGLQQPTTDRAFDPWSGFNEQFYWQLNRAMNTRDVKLLEDTLAKYDIRWVVYDESIVDTLSFTDIYTGKQKPFLETIPSVEKVKQFGLLHVYRVKYEHPPQAFVSVVSHLPAVSNAFHFASEDEAFGDFGDYRNDNEPEKLQAIYAFPSLFTNRSQDDLEVGFADKQGKLVLSSREFDTSKRMWQISIPNPVTEERNIPVRVFAQPHQTYLELSLEYVVPEVTVNNETLNPEPVQRIGIGGCLQKACILRLGDIYRQILPGNERTLILETLVPTHRSVALEVFPEGSSAALFSGDIDLSAIQALFAYPQKTVTGEHNTISAAVPALPELFDASAPFIQSLNSRQPSQCGNLPENGWSEKFVSTDQGQPVLTLQSQHGSSCDHLYYGQLPHDSGYVFKLVTRNISSMPLRVGIQSLSQDRSEIDTRLNATPDFTDSWLVVPPTEKFNSGYTLYLDSISFGREVSENQIKSISLWHIPYNQLKHIRLLPTETIPQLPETIINGVEVSHRFPWRYEVTLPSQTDNTSLILSQAYHDGWLAWGKDGLLKHFMVNNWENAWDIPAGTTAVTLLYWPQLLEFAGFPLFAGLIGYVFYTTRKDW